MNRKTKFTYLFLCISLLSMLITAIYFYPAKQNENEYTLKEYRGNLAVFTDDKNNPFEILDIKTAEFPEKDQQKLKNGITVYSEEELFRLLEDFSG